MRTRLFLSIFVLCLFILCPLSVSQSYQWKDGRGIGNFSDTQPGKMDSGKVKIREAEPGPDRAGSLLAKGKDKRPYRDIKVIMYMTDWCPYCVKARNLLNSLGVNLVEYNVEKDREKGEEARTKSGGGSGVPVLDVEGIIINGYSPERIKAAVEKRRDSF